jgi:hypothetical protein
MTALHWPKVHVALHVVCSITIPWGMTLTFISTVFYCCAALWFPEGVLAWDQTMTPWLKE